MLVQLHKLIIITLPMVLALAASPASSDPFTVPNVFADGDPAIASEVNANFAAIEAEINTLKSASAAPELPIGTVLISMLTTVQLQSQMGSGWVELLGQDVTGSAYSNLTGNNTLPNLTGSFIRDAGGDAGPVGVTQMGSVGPEGGASGLYIFQSNIHGQHRFQSDPAGNFSTVGYNYPLGAETRPRNVAMYHYIRVN